MYSGFNTFATEIFSNGQSDRRSCEEFNKIHEKNEKNSGYYGTFKYVFFLTIML